MARMLRLWWLRRRLAHALHRIEDLADARDYALLCYDFGLVDSLDSQIRQVRRGAVWIAATITTLNRRKP